MDGGWLICSATRWPPPARCPVRTPPRDIRRPAVFARPRCQAAGNATVFASEVCEGVIAVSGVNLWAGHAVVEGVEDQWVGTTVR